MSMEIMIGALAFCRPIEVCDIQNCVKKKKPMGGNKQARNVLICLTNGPDHQDGGGTGPLLSSHRWDVLRHILGPAVEREREGERQRGKERERRILFPLMKASFQL